MRKGSIEVFSEEFGVEDEVSAVDAGAVFYRANPEVKKIIRCVRLPNEHPALQEPLSRPPAVPPRPPSRRRARMAES
jgi:hypothetical protein